MDMTNVLKAIRVAALAVIALVALSAGNPQSLYAGEDPPEEECSDYIMDLCTPTPLCEAAMGGICGDSRHGEECVDAGTIACGVNPTGCPTGRTAICQFDGGGGGLN
jgi:hypothetical protein